MIPIRKLIIDILNKDFLPCEVKTRTNFSTRSCDLGKNIIIVKVNVKNITELIISKGGEPVN